METLITYVVSDTVLRLMSIIWEVTQALRRGKPVPKLTEGFVAGIEVPAGRRDVLVFDSEGLGGSGPTICRRSGELFHQIFYQRPATATDPRPGA
jgi:hypothetical protein